MTGLFDRLKDDDSEGSEIVEERPIYEENEAETPSEDENQSGLDLSLIHISEPTRPY